ncbi:MAG TPA: OmpA family protein [Cyclobacteriaceae bacterium]|nr:OmpA family protein [Cyclobacteriaceae bacterium]
MKLSKLFFVLALALICHRASAQAEHANYVTIGVFRIQSNAARFTEEANKKGFSAQYGFNPERKFYYVYVASESDLKTAWNRLMKVRTESEFKDAWVFLGNLEAANDIAKTEPKTEPPVEAKPEPKIEPAKEIEKPQVIVETPPAKDSVAKVATSVDSSTIKKETIKPKGKPFIFKMVSRTDGKELQGSVQLQEAIGASQYRLIKGGEVVYLEAPVNKRGAYGIITQVPGFKESLLTFDYTNPGGEKGPGDEEVITLELDKAKKGDYIDFNNVHFFKNTAIMQPSSKDELDALLSLLNENPKYKIKIYGYVNKKHSRESLTMGTSTQFFALDNKANKRATISAKELSAARAEVVKAYLVQQGVDAKRIATKGEGGAVPLYSEDGTLGERNDRVEVEFVKH